MKKETTRVFFYTGVVFLSMCFVCWIAIAGEQRQPEPVRRDTRNDDFSKLLPLEYAKRRQVDVYGKVVDQWTNGVPEADVRLSGYTAGWMIRQRDKRYEVWTKTDKAGLFHTVLEYPDTASLTASKEGYEFIRGGYYKEPVQHRTTAENPVVIRMRKRGEMTFLVKQAWGNVRSHTMFSAKGTNRMTTAWNMLKSVPYENSPLAEYTDIVFDGGYDANIKEWTLVICATNENDGLVLSDERLYEAPRGGYVKQHTIAVTNTSEQQKFIYLRSRQPTVYSRVELAYDLRGSFNEPPKLRVFYDFYLNPYGDRSLEFDERSDSAFGLAPSLRKEALEAFAAGRYPEKPKDMGKLAEETRERVAREQEESNRRKREWEAEQRKRKEAEGAWR